MNFPHSRQLYHEMFRSLIIIWCALFSNVSTLKTISLVIKKRKKKKPLASNQSLKLRVFTFCLPLQPRKKSFVAFNYIYKLQFRIYIFSSFHKKYRLHLFHKLNKFVTKIIICMRQPRY